MEKPAVVMSLVAAESNPRNVMKLHLILGYPGKGAYKLISCFGDQASNDEKIGFLHKAGCHRISSLSSTLPILKILYTNRPEEDGSVVRRPCQNTESPGNCPREAAVTEPSRRPTTREGGTGHH